MITCTERKSKHLLGALPEDVWERWRSHVASVSVLERTGIEEHACERHAVVGEHYHRWFPGGMTA